MNKTARAYLSDDIKKKIKGAKVVFRESQEKYSKNQFIRIYKGYDFLENLFVVRHYIQRHYEIDLDLLEVLLKLMSLRVFSIQDYIEIPKRYSTTSRFRSIRARGYVIVISDHYHAQKRIFTLSAKSKHIVTNFYQYLSGEKTIPEGRRLNPMARKNPKYVFDNRKMQLIKKMNGEATPEHIKTLFT